MLRPTKHTKIKYSVIYLAGMIMQCLKETDIVKYDELKEMLILKLGDEAKYQYAIALTFLYSINKIEYVENLDAIKYIN